VKNPKIRLIFMNLGFSRSEKATKKIGYGACRKKRGSRRRFGYAMPR